MEDVEIKQTRGPTLRFIGNLIAQDEWNSRGGPMRIEIWQTEGGALIPVSEGPMPNGERDVRAAVIAPLLLAFGQSGGQIAQHVFEAEEREQGMRFAVMDFFDWENRARSMVRKQLKWRLVRDVA